MVKKYTKRFDFEIGYLIKSPCKDCRNPDNFPKCAQTCTLLSEIQSILSQAVSCTRHYASLESAATSFESWRSK